MKQNKNERQSSQDQYNRIISPNFHAFDQLEVLIKRQKEKYKTQESKTRWAKKQTTKNQSDVHNCSQCSGYEIIDFQTQ